MSALPDENTAHKLSTESQYPIGSWMVLVYILTQVAAADNFVKSFYRSFENPGQRSALPSYFLEKTSEEVGGIPIINFNGTVSSAADFQKTVDAFAPTRLELASLDAQVINPALQVAGRSNEDAKKGKNMSILILVSGTMTIGKKEDDNKRIFSDSLVLVPNPKSMPGRRDRGHKEWVIQTYNSRVVGP